jgi:hypothetical protein
MDYYLQFESESTAMAVLYTQVPTEWDTEGTPTATESRANYANIDVIGTIYKPTGEVQDTDDGPVPLMETLPGYHVNVRVMLGEDHTALEPFAVTPSTPQRTWG